LIIKKLFLVAVVALWPFILLPAQASTV